MATPFVFDHHLAFTPAEAETLLRSVPAAPGVYALRGEDPAAEPYLSRTADLRRRLRRLLAPPEALDADGNPVLSRRLNLRDRVRSIDYTRTGSDFESTLLLYHATRSAFGAEDARRRLRLHTPYFIRVTVDHKHPRAYVTNKLTARSLPESFGPFASRAAAERYCDAVLDLFQLRRCWEDLTPHPDHPGCAYGEMNKCLQPCKGAAFNPPESYTAETIRVVDFFRTRGQSLLDAIGHNREAASEAMDFEGAATLHKQWEKARAASLLGDEVVRPAQQLRAVILQPVAPPETAPDSAPGSEPQNETHEAAAVFLLARGRLCGPVRLSTLGVRAVREQTAVGSSLFAQPLMLAPVPLTEPITPPTDHNAVILSEASQLHRDAQPKDPEAAPPATSPSPISTATLAPEDRARAVLAQLEAGISNTPDLAELCDSLSLFRRWYYRPEKQRTGEVFLPTPSVGSNDTSWPIRRILNGAARIALGPPTAVSAVDREAAKALKTKKLHEGREGVEREVPVLPKRRRQTKNPTPAASEETRPDPASLLN